jgi:hypothetical protein
MAQFSKISQYFRDLTSGASVPSISEDHKDCISIEKEIKNKKRASLRRDVQSIDWLYKLSGMAHTRIL